MSRQIIDYDDPEYRGLLVNTFWGGKLRGECVQVTEGGPGNNDWDMKGYVTMTREEAIIFFSAVLKKLEYQIEQDKENPPWWQEIATEKHEASQGDME
jgi:hypothetical protein